MLTHEQLTMLCAHQAWKIAMLESQLVTLTRAQSDADQPREESEKPPEAD